MADEDRDSVCIRFVLLEELSNEDESSRETKLCFKNCLEYNLKPTWIEEKKCLELQPNKRDVFVCEKFEGTAFEYLRNFKCVVLGPRALLCCLQEEKPIPDGGTTIFTLAMKDLVLTCTNFTEEDKDVIAEKVGFMGGHYSKRLVAAVTHLVANSVRSVKYEKAIEMGIPVMSGEWVDAVWVASQVRDVSAIDQEFEPFKCPTFKGLVVSCTNLMRAEKERVKSLIENNGGEFSGILESERTKILVVKDKTSNKYKYARLWHLPCVLPSWVYKSAKAGYALNVANFELETVFARQCSTPVQGSQGHLPDISTISSIGSESNSNRKQVDETRSDETRLDETAISCAASEAGSSKHSSSRGPGQQWTKNYDVIRKLDLREAKKAGNFLDGCNVYLSGFSPDMNEKLRRVLNGGGATRFNEISSKVSHIVVGEFVAADMKAVRASSNRPHVVTAEWIIESVKLHCPAPEDQFACLDVCPSTAEPPSPSLKKGLQLLQSKTTPVRFPLLDETADLDLELQPEAEHPMSLIPQYLNQERTFHDIDGINLFKKPSKENSVQENVAEETAMANSGRRDTQDTMAEGSSAFTDGEGTQVPMFFAELTFLVVGFDKETEAQENCEAIVEKHGGCVVNRAFKGIPDYGVVPFHGATLYHPTNEVVTSLWLEDCEMTGKLVPIEYFHQPVALPSVAFVLQGVVLGFSAYGGRERQFLILLAERLGAIPQEVFARRDNAKKNAVASTHLVCKEASGTKYEAALKWNLPAVTHKWLLACLRERRQVPVDGYVVGEDSQTLSTSVLDLSAISQVPNKPSVEPPTVNGAGLSLASERSNGSKASGQELPTVTTPMTTTMRNYGFSQETPIRFPRLSTGTPQRRSIAVQNQYSPLVKTGDPSLRFKRVDTPETPYGILPNPSPETRKRMLGWINKMPEFEKDESPVMKARRLSTPMSTLRKRCWEKFGGEPEAASVRTGEGVSGESGAEESSTPKRYAPNSQLDTSEPTDTQETLPLPMGAGINTQLNQLNELLLASPSTEANTSEEATKLLSRRPSVLSTSQKPLIVVNAPENKTIETAVKESQSDVIGWADHSRHNIKDDENNISRPVGVEDSINVPVTPPKFMLSNMENRARYVKIITSLGGTVTESETFDSEATHLVCSKTTRSEKLLACIASGKWILHSTYLDDSLLQGHFLKEELYEWGNPAAEDKIGRLATQSLDCKLAKAAHRWRKKLAGSEEGGAFKDIRAIVHTNKVRVGAIKRLIMAGGGSIEEASFPFSDPGMATHCFLERNKIQTSIDMKALHANGVLCLESIFLNNFLIENPPPVDVASVVPAYRQLMRE